MEEKFRTQVARLGAPGGVDALLQESLDAQVQLKAAKEEMTQRDELLGASTCWAASHRPTCPPSDPPVLAQLARGTPSTRSTATWLPPMPPPPPRWLMPPRLPPSGRTRRLRLRSPGSS